MTPAERAREIVETFNREAPHGFELWGEMRQRLEADIAAALAAQPAPTQRPRTLGEVVNHRLEQERDSLAAQTRALREALEALIDAAYGFSTMHSTTEYIAMPYTLEATILSARAVLTGAPRERHE